MTGNSPFPNQIQPFDFGMEKHIEPSRSVDEDFEVSRKNLMLIMETTKGAIQSLSLIAFQAQDPDSFDVLNKLIKTYSDQQSQLLQMYRIKEMKEARQASNPSPIQGEIVDNRTQNVNFYGTPAEMAKMLEEGKLLPERK